jgi:hypothetical protein
MAPKMELAGQAIRGLSQQSEQASRSIAVLNDSDWVFKTAAALVFMQNAGEEMRAYSGPIPSDLQPVHSQVTVIGRDLVQTADDYARGVDSRSAELILRSAQRIDGMNARLQTVQRDLQVLRQRYNL